MKICVSSMPDSAVCGRDIGFVVVTVVSIGCMLCVKLSLQVFSVPVEERRFREFSETQFGEKGKVQARICGDIMTRTGWLTYSAVGNPRYKLQTRVNTSVSAAAYVCDLLLKWFFFVFMDACCRLQPMFFENMRV